MHPVTVFICTACRHPSAEADADAIAPGEALIARLVERLPCDDRIKIQPTDCLAVCDRPCTIAFSGRDKWTYLIGDIDPKTDFEDILLTINRLIASDQPVLSLAERPAFFRKGVIGRVPPV